ncbi:DMT family transporter [Arsenicicoccus dermatophilus]|uniref:DMT family transporter n=1 Tax=Arsenicicoccus dermatophilus TaxID=1076331 RepID=UPI001F4C7C2D|nr:DMT family transporter [Arsenicicoccus dermatophilus]MCH8612998.1 DMT family transporter [Arsenicicoccus dermatophilus]
MTRPRWPWQVSWLVLVLVWGASFLLMKVGLDALVPLQISTLRVLTGCLVVVTLLRLTGGRLPRGRHVWGHLMVVGLFLATVPFTFFALGETRVSSALAGIGNAITPIATVGLTMVFVRDEHFSRPKLLGVLLGFLGVVVIMQPWAAAERPDLLGFAMTLLAGSSYGVGRTWHRLHLKEHDPGGLAVPAAQLLCASGQLVVILVGACALGLAGVTSPWEVHLRHGSGSVPWSLAAVLALGAVGTGLAFSLQFQVVRAAGATVATTVTYLIPCVSILLGVLVLGEAMDAWTLVGFAIVLAGAVLVGMGNRWAASWAARRQGRS